MMRSLRVTLTIAMLASSCTGNSDKPEVLQNTPTSGEVSIAIDRSVMPLIEEEVNTFMGLYPQATIDANFLQLPDVTRSLTDKRVNVAILPGKLSESDSSFFATEKIPVTQIRFGMDAIAFITHPKNADTTLTYDELKAILSGQLHQWNQLNSANAADSIVIVFDQPKSSIIQFLKEKLLGAKPLPSNAFAMDSMQAVMEYVRQQPGAIGVISVSWISERSEQERQQFLEGLHVMALSHPDSARVVKYYQPTRNNMLYGRYPLRRDLYLVLTEGHMGLGTGFANFMTSEQGQMIVHRFGLVAAKQPVRVIELRNEF